MAGMAAATDTDGLNVKVIGGQELAAHLGSLLSEVECNGTTLLVKDLRTGRVRASIVPGVPEGLTGGADLLAACTNGSGHGGA